ncbi:hypothetical protein [Rhodoligotrophos defluvii]|uniref:hypothetical protein n=1 Tax=Rhodoligotrophos defluvii TaxID=2561934 RepID=UPI0019622504|nr:hypothetical protein [Rhodoligotrophos defluvii]
MPYPATTAAGQIVCEIGRLRDACLLLAGERPYREYPADWVVAHLERAGFRVLDVKSFNIRYGERFVNEQLNMCARRIARLADRALAGTLQQHVEDLRKRALALNATAGGLRHGADYVVAAEAA